MQPASAEEMPTFGTGQLHLPSQFGQRRKFGRHPDWDGTQGKILIVPECRWGRDTSLHLEAFYKHQLSDNIQITPGVIWLTAPNHNQNNDDIVIVLRTVTDFSS